MQVPASLITTSWNLMKLNKDHSSTNQNPASVMGPTTSHISANQNTSISQGSGQHVYMQHMKLQDKLLKVRIDPAISADGLSVENDYSKEVGIIEMDRYRALNSCTSDEVRNTINAFYDKQRLRLIDATEGKLDKLITKAENMRQAVMKSNKMGGDILVQPIPQRAEPLATLPDGAQGASLLLKPADEKDKLNAVRKLKFNTSEENMEDDDYLNCSVNSEDFEIDEIDVETVDKENRDCPNKNRASEQEVNILETDILKKCIEESGIHTLNHSFPALAQNNVSESNLESSHSSSISTTSNSILPDSTSSASHSPISMASTDESSNQNLSTNSSFGNPVSFNQNIPTISPITNKEPLNKEPSKEMTYPAINFGSLFSTPTTSSNRLPQFTNPDALNMALSEIQKLCGGPRVNFTPELRKESNHPSFTPDTGNSKTSPFNEIANTLHYGDRKNSQVKAEVTTGSAMCGYQKPVQTLVTSVSTAQMSTYNQNHHHEQQKQQQQQRVIEPQALDIKNNNIQYNQISQNTKKEGVSITSTQESSNADGFKFENTPMFRTHRMLTLEATEVLNTWYNNNVQYPYPNDTQVAQLSQLTGITARQVKKWMANKRVRCFNTLSITGNQHPIKYKYQGKGRKRKAEPIEKENCDSTTSDKRPNYTMLHETAKQILNQWYEDHIHNPYPTDLEKQQLANQCAINAGQVKSWFANKRNRTNNTKRQVPNYFIHKYPQYSQMVEMVGQKREEERMLKRRKMNEFMYVQPPFYL